jgi:pre-mRNA-splicing factor ISY1
MAKNEEEAHAMLNRWVAMKKDLNSRTKDKRPSLSTECNNLQECGRWREQVVKEITKRVTHIQNASLGEYKIREINDEINKLFREKGHWENRIKELGGPDYKKLAPRTIDANGYELPGSGGYKYWGAAKDLPGVRELFAKEQPNAPKKARADLYKCINFEYYGLKDEEDGKLLEEESKTEEWLMEEYLKDIEELQLEVSNKKRKLDEGDMKTSITEFEDIEFNKFKNLHTHSKLIFNLDITHQTYIDKPTDDDLEKLTLIKHKEMLIKKFKLEDFEDLVKENAEILKENKVIN